MSNTQEVRLRLSNSSARQVTFVLEPWGETYPFDTDDELTIVARGPEGDSLEIDFAEGMVSVWGWSGSTARLYRNGEELGTGKHERTAVPRTATAETDAPHRPA